MKLFRKPLMSVIVIFYNMRREAPRTLQSLSAAYQRTVDASEYEVIVVDNASSEPLDEASVRQFGAHFRYYYFDTDSPSPVAAINFAARQARGKFIGIFIDGARILTPGLLYYTKTAIKAFPNPIVSTLGWHLGPELQNVSITKGYDKAREDALLQHINWPEDGYRLFEISTLAGSSASGFFLPIAESNGCFISRKLYQTLGGFDEGFQSPGGGLVNLDFYRRALLTPTTQLVILLSEGTFHQLHGGIMTNIPAQANRNRWDEFETEYRRLRGENFQRVTRDDVVYLGSVPASALEAVRFSAEHALREL